MSSQVATTIRDQIGAGALMNVGARDFSWEANSLIFKTGNGRKIRAVTVTLEDSDTYTVRYVEMNRRTYKLDTDTTLRDIYCDQLAEIVIDLAG